MNIRNVPPPPVSNLIINMDRLQHKQSNYLHIIGQKECSNCPKVTLTVKLLPSAVAACLGKCGALVLEFLPVHTKIRAFIVCVPLKGGNAASLIPVKDETFES
eukprot:834758-Pelagomonas_calceolata.AAC.2